jgi:hypothetical protein
VAAALPEIAIGVPGDTSLVVCHRFDTQFRDIRPMCRPDVAGLSTME